MPKSEKIKISFIGGNSDGVTGSCILISTQTRKILLECGMVQSHSNLIDYKTNSQPFQFKAKQIDYVLLGHAHIDHSGLVPKLVRDGFDGRIITTEITAKLLGVMLKDSANIVRKDAEYISRMRGKDVYPFYNEDDVFKTLDLTYEYGYGEIYVLDEYVSFRFLKNSHIIGAAQTELFIKDESGHIHKILYTSDLGSVKSKNHYVDQMDFCSKSNIVISECTYGSSIKNGKKDRNKDLEKIQTVVNQVCIQDKGRVLIPVFSLARAQQILTDLYMTYGSNKDFNIPIVVDSPLIWEITKAYKSVLKDENLELFEKVCNWKNVKFIKDHNESKVCVADKSPKIVLSSSGFLVKGRSVNYLKEFISCVKDHILFVGYSPEQSVAGKIKNGQKYITIDGKSYKNKCGITTLNSFSSHISQTELLNYLKSINADKFFLVHGDMESKIEFKELLEEEFSKMCKSSRVIAVNKGTVASL